MDGALIHFSDADPEATDAAFAEVSRDEELTGFGLQIDSGDLGVGELIAAKDKELDPETGLKMMMSATFVYANTKQPVSTPQFAVRAIPRQPEYVLDAHDGIGPIFSCHSHWYKQAERYGGRRFTNCHGSCDTGSCTCWRSNSRSCWGYWPCFC